MDVRLRGPAFTGFETIAIIVGGFGVSDTCGRATAWHLQGRKVVDLFPNSNLRDNPPFLTRRLLNILIVDRDPPRSSVMITRTGTECNFKQSIRVLIITSEWPAPRKPDRALIKRKLSVSRRVHRVFIRAREPLNYIKPGVRYKETAPRGV